MAIDTEPKRCSALGTRRLPWMRRFIPIPDGGVNQGDRQQAGFDYRGIDAVSPSVVTTFIGELPATGYTSLDLTAEGFS